MLVPYVDLGKQYLQLKAEIDSAVLKSLQSGDYIGGRAVDQLEDSFSKLCQVKHSVAVANGTDALILAMKVLGIGKGDEVITAPNSWVSSASTIALVDATPVFVDVLEDQNLDVEKLEGAITKKTKAIIPVHLTGKSAKMDKVLAIAKKHKLYVIEDSAQAVGSKFNDKPCGSMGDINCFSLHPLKNLNACGDAGIITTNNDEFYEKLRLIGKHGMPNRNTVNFWGYNSRLDSIQAAILNVRIKHLEKTLNKRRDNALRYFENLNNKSLVKFLSLPFEDKNCVDTFHLFVIQCDRRDELKAYLESKNIGTAIHYPTPIHLQPAAKYLGYKKGDFPVVEKQSSRILSLPVSDVIGFKEVDYVSNCITEFFQN